LSFGFDCLFTPL
jgi:hypothetical protein